MFFDSGSGVRMRVAYLSREKALNFITKRANFSAWRNLLSASHKELIDFAHKALSAIAAVKTQFFHHPVPSTTDIFTSKK
jgi:hypothetical protein